MAKPSKSASGKKNASGTKAPGVGDVVTTSPDLVAEQTTWLRERLPNIATDGGKIDFERLRAELGDAVDTGTERYVFSWAGKRDAVQVLQLPSHAALTPDVEESVDFDATQNLFIEGDNLEALKLLYKPYFGRIKAIYIDPPYNTGGDFVYLDDYTDPLDSYLASTGQKDEHGNVLTSNPETSGRYHSAWLSMMYPRLFLARQLLRDDGVIFVSIDDHEFHNLRMLMNEVFGEENFVTTIAWQSRQSIQNDTDLSVNHEYVAVYAKLRRQKERRLKPANGDKWYTLPGFAAYPLPLDPKKFENPDGDVRGPWQGNPFDAPNVRPNLTYAIKNPNTSEDHWPPAGRCWRTDEASYKKLLADGRIVFGKSGNARPQLKVFYEEMKDYGRVENTWFAGSEHGTATHGTKELQELFEGRSAFDSPKPTSLIKSLLRVSTRADDLVLDFFAGSGTTAHAVLDLNAEDAGKRRFILVQLPEPTPKDSTARDMGFETISQLARERIRRVIKRMTEKKASELDLKAGQELADNGFRAFHLAASSFQPWLGLNDKDPDEYASQMEIFTDPLVDGWKPLNVVWEVAVKEGFSLASRIEPLSISGNELIRVHDEARGQAFVICLDEILKPETLKKLELTPQDLFVCRDSAIDDSAAANLALQCRLKTI